MKKIFIPLFTIAMFLSAFSTVAYLNNAIDQPPRLIIKSVAIDQPPRLIIKSVAIDQPPGLTIKSVAIDQPPGLTLKNA